MERDDVMTSSSSRPAAGLTVSATTLMALLVMAAALPGAATAGEVDRNRSTEPTAVVREAPTARAVAAAIQAVARDLIGPTASAMVPARTLVIEDSSSLPVPQAPAIDSSDRPQRMLAERLLALPPPAC